MTSTCQSIFPTELLLRILSLTTPRDVIRWRTVSKFLYAVTYMPEIWKTLYANAPFMRPYELPPIDCIDLKLIELERFAQSWIEQPFKESELSCVPLATCISFRNRNLLIGGRWSIACELEHQFSLHDIYPGPKSCRLPRVLWFHTDKIISWRNIFAMSKEGQWVAYVILWTENTSHWILLELWWDAETGSPCSSVSMEIPGSCITDRHVVGRVSSRHSRFIYLPAQSLVFDTTTRVFYKFPALTLAFDQTRSRIHSASQPDVSVKLTSTHVIVLRDYSRARKQDPVVAQAFIVPDDQCAVKNGQGVLHLSHEGVFDSRQTDCDVIRNSVTDSLTGSINVRLLERRKQPEWRCPAHEPCCIDLTLHKPRLQDVSPMTITRHDVIMKGFAPTKEESETAYNRCWDISDEGYARGISLRNDGTSVFTGTKQRVVKFAIDATGDRCVVIYGNHIVTGPALRRSEALYLFPYLSSFDGGRGILSFIRFHIDPVVLIMRIE